MMIVKLKQFVGEHVPTIKPIRKLHWSRKRPTMEWTLRKMWKNHRRKMRMTMKWCWCQQVRNWIFFLFSELVFLLNFLVAICVFRSEWMDIGQYSIVAIVDNEEIRYWTGADTRTIPIDWRWIGENVTCRILGMRWIEMWWQYIGQTHCPFGA